MVESKKSINLLPVFSSIIIVCLVIECAFLIVQNRELKHTINTTTSVGGAEFLSSGESVDSFGGETLDGNRFVMRYNDPTRKHLFFVLSTTCPHCEKTLPTWNLISKSRHENVDIFGISIHNLEETRKFITSREIGFYSVTVGSDTSFSRKYKISGVPETILISESGVVENIWVGELSPEQAEEIKNKISAPKALIN